MHLGLNWLIDFGLTGRYYVPQCIMLDLKMGRYFLLYTWHFPEYIKPRLICPFYALICPMLVLGGESERQGRLLLKRQSALNLGNLICLPCSKWAPHSASLEVAYKPGTCLAHFFSFKVTLACFK